MDGHDQVANTRSFFDAFRECHRGFRSIMGFMGSGKGFLYN